MNVKHLALSVLAAGGLFALAPAVPATAEPALWKVTGSHAIVYLFGTVHLLKPATQWRSPKIEAAFASASTLWEEIANADDAAAAQSIVAQLGLDPAHPLSAQLDDPLRAKLSAFEAAYNLPPGQIDALRPWLAALQFQALPERTAGYDPKSGVELTLKAAAAAQGKPTMGFETLEQQMHFFADLPQKLQIDFLSFTLDATGQTVARTGDIVDAWAAGDVDKLGSLVDNAALFKRYPALYRTLVVDRNRAFADKIEQMLKGNGVSFVAVGAGHFVGQDSVQADLAKDGIIAVRQ